MAQNEKKPEKKGKKGKEGKKRTALVTGASAGLGKDLARIFAENGFNLVLVARRAGRLQQLAETLEKDHTIQVLCLARDLARPEAAREIHAEVRNRNIPIDALVCNAGYTVPGFYADTPWHEQGALLQVMVTGLAELCHLFAPAMGERNYGRIINVASLAGHLPGAAGGTLYTAAKSFVVRFSQSLSLEYTGRNVHVCALCPGSTHTEFHDVAGKKGYTSQLPAFLWMDSETVAREGFDAVMRGEPVWINGWINRAIALFVRLIPQRWAYRLMARNQRNAQVTRDKTRAG